MTEVVAVDPRPKVIEREGQYLVEGWACSNCGYSVIQTVPRCPECKGGMAVSYFGPTGKVHGATTIRVRVPGQQHPYSVAYVLFPGGPRILAHTPGDKPLPLGAEVRLKGLTPNGDLAVEPEGVKS